MPPNAAITPRDLLYWQYAKMLSESVGFGKDDFGFIMNWFKKLKSCNFEWFSSVKVWLRKRENPNAASASTRIRNLIPYIMFS